MLPYAKTLTPRLKINARFHGYVVITFDRPVCFRPSGDSKCPNCSGRCKQRPSRGFSSRISVNQKEGGTRTAGVPDILYQRFELLQRSLGQLPQFLGGFVVGVPLQDFQKVKQSTSCNSDATIFDALIGVDWETIKLYLDIHRQGIPDREQSIYPGGRRSDERL
jgi:hypothetical protein